MRPHLSSPAVLTPSPDRVRAFVGIVTLPEAFPRTGEGAERSEADEGVPEAGVQNSIRSQEETINVSA